VRPPLRRGRQVLAPLETRPATKRIGQVGAADRALLKIFRYLGWNDADHRDEPSEYLAALTLRRYIHFIPSDDQVESPFEEPEHEPVESEPVEVAA
jgi:hypothetical protein